MTTNPLFVSGTRIVSKADTYYYHQDHLGSSSVLTDSNGLKEEEIHTTRLVRRYQTQAQPPQNTNTPPRSLTQKQDYTTITPDTTTRHWAGLSQQTR